MAAPSRKRKLNEISGDPVPGRQELTRRRPTPLQELVLYLGRQIGAGPRPLGQMHGNKN